MTAAATHRLTRLEIASGLVLGVDGRARRAAAGARMHPRQALEEAILPALRRPPCLVSFSGGRDSSAILAIAAALARREGLPLPVPATNRFPAVAAADETDWQERVVEHLGLEDWARVEHDGALDVVGPVARDVLRRHGLLWPFNAHFHVPLLRLAAGGSLLTGIGGDELLTERAWVDALSSLRSGAGSRRRALLRLGLELAPPALRAATLRRRRPLAYRWLRPDAVRELTAAWASQRAAEPLRWRAHVRWVGRLRYLDVGAASLERLARDEDVLLLHPFLDSRFATSLAALPPGRRPRTRDGAMYDLAGALLPRDVLGRQSKSSFDAAFWSDTARAFAAAWDGNGVDDALVDARALRDEWLSAAPDPRSFLLAQAVWLERSADGVEQQVERAR